MVVLSCAAAPADLLYCALLGWREQRLKLLKPPSQAKTLPPRPRALAAQNAEAGSYANANANANARPL